MHQRFQSGICSLKTRKITFLSIVKVAAKYAIIDRVGSLDAGFQQIPLVQNFWNFHDIVMEHQKFEITEENQNIPSRNFLSKNPVYYRNCLDQTHFCHKINFTVNV